MEIFTLRASEDSVEVRLDEVFGFPDHTSYFGGYNVRGTVEINCGAYRVRGPLWFSTGEVWQFYTDLRAAYDALAGQARSAPARTISVSRSGLSRVAIGF